MTARSIGERIKKSSSLDRRKAIALEWQAAWKSDNDITIHLLERAIGEGRMGEAGHLLGQLKTLTEKRLGALPNVIEKLADDDI
ncbi:MAG: hypothetical protein JWM58_1646 [Rhizobium sp.]|nr:hypothetical protein [Rhizobium sp.]